MKLVEFHCVVMIVLLLVWVGIFLLDLSIFYSSMLNPTKCLILLTIGISKPAPYSIASHPTEKCSPTFVTSFLGRNNHILAPCHFYLGYQKKFDELWLFYNSTMKEGSTLKYSRLQISTRCWYILYQKVQDDTTILKR